jgi:hypothetical protein
MAVELLAERATMKSRRKSSRSSHIRMLKNGFQPAKYFRTEHWRFVTDEDVTKILTIERPNVKGW